MVLLQVISKNGKVWENTKITVDDSSDIRTQIYEKSRQWPGFFPSFLFVLEKKDGNVFVESLMNVLKGLSIDKDLEDEDFQEHLFTKLVKNYKDLTKDHYLNAIIYTLTEPEEREDITLAIREQSLLVEKKYVVLEDDEEEEPEPFVKILRFKTSFGKIYEQPVDLQKIYDSIALSGDLILAKSFYGNTPEYLQEGQSVVNQKAIESFVFSEHFTDKKEKILVNGVINFFIFNGDSKIYGKISDIGIIGLKIEPRVMNFKNYDLSSVKDTLQLVYTQLTGKTNSFEDFSGFEIKVIYPRYDGYYPKKLVAEVEGSEVKNDKVEFLLEERRVWYSSNKEIMNFTIKNINDENDIPKMFDMINKRVGWYSKNLLKVKAINALDVETGGDTRKVVIFTEEPHQVTKKDKMIKVTNSNFDGIYKIIEVTSSSLAIDVDKSLKVDGKLATITMSGVVKKHSIKLLKRLGLVVNSKECEKKRRPVLLPKNDTTSAGDNILDINGRKFKCLPPYNYHGIVNKVNCCYKLKQTGDVVKKVALKLFDKMKKGSVKVLEGTLVDYLTSEFQLKSPEDDPKDRTIENCIKFSYGENVIKESIEGLSDEDYEKYFKNNSSLVSWKDNEVKAIDDIILAVQIYMKVNILLFLENTIDGLYVKCQNFLDFDKYLVIYKSSQRVESYYLLCKGEAIQFEELDIQDLVDISKNSCKTGFNESLYHYRDIVVRQVTDYQNLVVFIEINTGCYIPITPSTVDESLPVISINSLEFVLLTPESQYKSLILASKKYPNLTPIGLTKINGEEIVTGIKIQNGGIVPVSHSIWHTVLLPDVDDLFYIEIYKSQKEDFVYEEEAFKKNLANFYEIADIELLNTNVNNQDYFAVINMVKVLNIPEDEISRLTWYLINKN
jgi:hypothetical protein